MINKETSIEVESENVQRAESQLKENDKSSFLEPPRGKNMMRSRSRSDKKKISGGSWILNKVFENNLYRIVGRTEPDESRDGIEFLEGKQTPQMMKGSESRRDISIDPETGTPSIARKKVPIAETGGGSFKEVILK